MSRHMCLTVRFTSVGNEFTCSLQQCTALYMLKSVCMIKLCGCVLIVPPASKHLKQGTKPSARGVPALAVQSWEPQLRLHLHQCLGCITSQWVALLVQCSQKSSAFYVAFTAYETMQNTL